MLTVVNGDWNKAPSGAVVVTLGEESMAAIGGAIQAFFTAALANVGEFVRADYTTAGISEIPEILDYISQGKMVFIAYTLGDLSGKTIVTSYQSGSVITHIAAFNWDVVEGAHVDAAVDALFNASHIVILGIAKTRS